MMSDDEMFLNLGEYAHGLLIGHQVPCEHLLFEARLSERDFPWLAEHRVHHASIMPTAGYIELLLQAFEGVPLHVETLEFLQPYPIPRTPVRLHTELFPVANTPNEFTFTISSRSYETEAHSELHSRGKVRLVSSGHPVNVPLRLADIDTTPFAPYYFVGESDFYERVDASLGETYPNALFIQTHREPTQFMGSWNSFVERAHSLIYEPQPRETFGAEQLALMSDMMDRAVHFREAHPVREQRRMTGASQLQPLKNALGNALDREHDPAPKKRRVEHVLLLPISAHNVRGHSLRWSD